MLREEEYLLGNVERIQLPDYMPNELLEELKKMFAKLVKQNPEKKFIEPVNFRVDSSNKCPESISSKRVLKSKERRY